MSHVLYNTRMVLRQIKGLSDERAKRAVLIQNVADHVGLPEHRNPSQIRNRLLEIFDLAKILVFPRGPDAVLPVRVPPHQAGENHLGL